VKNVKVCVYMCVREREREGGSECVDLPMMSLLLASLTPLRVPFACVLRGKSLEDLALTWRGAVKAIALTDSARATGPAAASKQTPGIAASEV
jgi:hypothetical protein